MKLYLDEDLSPQIARRLREAGVDAVSAIEAGNVQLSDREQLQYAAAEGRVLVSRNVRHFIVLAKDAIARQEPHSGIVLCSSRWRGFEIVRIVTALRRVVQQHPAGLGPFDVLYL
jgi:predicted nuclease of predicted toxin-antitoxin system